MQTGQTDQTDDAYQALRPLLFSIAYRMVGSVSEAEDLVQDAFLRFHRTVRKGTTIESPKAYLSATVTRLAINHLRSARVRRERYVGTWLPEPLLTSPDDETARHAEIADSLSMAFLVLLERLSPVERAVFVLREVLGYGYDEIAGMVGKSQENARQIFARAHRHVDARKPRFEASRARREELARRFFAAVEEGDTQGLVGMLSADAAMYGDGGGKAPALREPLHGAERVARFLAGLGRQGQRMDVRLVLTEINGQPGSLAVDSKGRLLNAFALDIVDGEVQAVRSVVNPDKLGHLGEVADVAQLLRDRGPAGT
jgi:RNA polymerase sigma-70 factor (ECF subfamily)